MKNIPIRLLNIYGRRTRGTCFLAKIVERAPGTGVYAFTTLDAVIRFNDGEHDLVYVPTQSLAPQNMLGTNDMDVDNTELHGWFDEIVEAAAVAGNLRSAELTLYRVSYAHLSAGAEIMAYGLVGKVGYSASKQGYRKVEFRGLDQLLKSVRNPLYSLTCRWDFGDENCGMPYVWEPAEVVEVDDPMMRFRVAGISRPDNWFELGAVMFDAHPLTGSDIEIERWTSDGWVTTAFPVRYSVEVGMPVRLRQDCHKTPAACKSYGNIIRMGAEHLTPVQDQSLMVPGAYIKTTNAL